MSRADFPQLLFSDEHGRIYPFEGLEAAGMKAGSYFKLDPTDFVKLPGYSELFMLPDRYPVGWDPQTGQQVVLQHDPYSKKPKKAFAVAAFIPPGYTATHHAAYVEWDETVNLPLFSYAACVLYRNEIYATAVRVDEHARHDERQMDPAAIQRGIAAMKQRFPGNRLVPHLEGCATVNACANAKNFFLGRYEAPIPSSPVCNAQCQGCISFQPETRDYPSNQQRIRFIPKPEEIADLALYHLSITENPIISFGQGCEGEPTLSGDVIEKSIRLIREKSSKGSINMNTNASRPEVIGRLFDAGLNSIRVSMNSVREPYYTRYYQPKGYTFQDVVASIDVAKSKNGFVSINYLSMPGFTDSEEEYEALCDFIREHRIDMIQWRNLNYDPLQYFRDLKLTQNQPILIGMNQLLQRIHKQFPKLLSGYFNPLKETIQEHLKV